MTISPKLGGIAIGAIILALLAGYFFFWRLGQAPPSLNPVQEKTIADLEAANEKVAKERESLKRQAQEAVGRAVRAETEAAKARAKLKELEVLQGQIRAKRDVINPEDALKELEAMGWLK